MAKSKFLKVKSPDSDYTVVIFDKCDTVVKDPVTGSTIALLYQLLSKKTISPGFGISFKYL